MKISISLLTAAAFMAALGGTLKAAEDFRISLSDAKAAVAASAPGSPEKLFADAPGVPAHGYTPAELKTMARHNTALEKSADKGLLPKARPGQYRPYADYEAPGYLIMSADFNFNSAQAKLEMAKILPADATLVIFTASGDAAAKEGVLKAYEGAVPRERIKVITLYNARQGFWARDGIPVPMLDKDNKLTVVDAVYGHGFEPDAEIARIFHAGLEKHSYYFEGGNFQANHTGTCIMVNHGAHVNIPDDVFRDMYGCSRQLVRLPFVDGIGHVDEHVRFISEGVVVTDIPQYKDILQGKGLTAHMLPKPPGPYETYANSLIMNGKVVVPVFSRDTDAQALAVYESLGLKASGGASRSLSNQGQGSVHCITMTYPKVPMAELLKALGAKEL